MRPKLIIFFLFFFFLFVYPALAVVTVEEAVNVSKDAIEVKNLLNKHPDAFALARNDTYGERSCWEVDWWTSERIESKLPYPNVRVWVDMETGEVLNAGIPRGGDTPESDYVVHGLWWMITIGVIIVIAVGSLILALAHKRKRKQG